MMIYKNFFLFALSISFTTFFTFSLSAQLPQDDKVKTQLADLTRALVNLKFNQKSSDELTDTLAKEIQRTRELLKQPPPQTDSQILNLLDQTLKQALQAMTIFSKFNHGLCEDEGDGNKYITTPTVLKGVLSPLCSNDRIFQNIENLSHTVSQSNTLLVKKRIIESVIDQIKISDQKLVWTLDYIFDNGKLPNCNDSFSHIFNEYTEQKRLQSLCHQYTQLMKSTDSNGRNLFPSISFKKLEKYINHTISTSQKKIEESLNKEMKEWKFNYTKKNIIDHIGDNYSITKSDIENEYDAKKIFFEELRPLERVKNITGIGIIFNTPHLSKKSKEISNAGVSLTCIEQKGGLRNWNCGYEIKPFSSINESDLKKGLSEAKKIIVNNSKSIHKLEKQLLKFDRALSQQELMKIKDSKRVFEIINEAAIDEILVNIASKHPESLGAALLENPDYVNELCPILDTINKKIDLKKSVQFYSDLIILAGSFSLPFSPWSLLGTTVSAGNLKLLLEKLNEDKENLSSTFSNSGAMSLFDKSAKDEFEARVDHVLSKQFEHRLLLLPIAMGFTFSTLPPLREIDQIMFNKTMKFLNTKSSPTTVDKIAIASETENYQLIYSALALRETTIPILEKIDEVNESVLHRFFYLLKGNKALKLLHHEGKPEIVEALNKELKNLINLEQELSPEEETKSNIDSK